MIEPLKPGQEFYCRAHRAYFAIEKAGPLEVLWAKLHNGLPVRSGLCKECERKYTKVSADELLDVRAMDADEFDGELLDFVRRFDAVSIANSDKKRGL